mmetsp:Transcript_19454/g.57576  ORF Transcript_19454/g.57576 Transcript_19454/m.57576 type:complete len:133 (-) Transcript_19454:8-406(-)
MAVVSDDHADETLNVSNLDGGAASTRWIKPDEVREHKSKESFWAVVDGFVVDATEFVRSHPGGLRKLLQTDDPDVGATGEEFGFSFSRGRNAHFPHTGKTFASGVKRYLRDPSCREVAFGGSKIIIVGRLLL